MSGNYLRKSIVAAGLDPDDLPAPGPDAMNFQSASGAKAWRDIWGSGQGIGVVDKVTPAADLIARLAKEYAAAKAKSLRLAERFELFPPFRRQSNRTPALTVDINVSEIALRARIRSIRRRTRRFGR